MATDPNLSVSDPQHYANPDYQGLDFLVLDFVRHREQITEQLKRQMEAGGPEPETTVQLQESEVQAKVAESNAQYMRGALKREIINSYYNHPLILHDFGTGRGKNLDGAVPGSKGPALIIGSGPTLDGCHDLIRGWKGGLFCSSSQGITMLALGKRDFQMVAVDVKTESDEFMPLDEWQDKNVTLIIHPGVDPEVIQAWRWNKRYFRITVHNMLFYTDVQPLAFPMITTTLYVYGCAVSTEITCAALMGYNPLFLCGCDFGYPREQSRFRQYHKINGEWTLAEPETIRYARHAKVTFRNRCSSDNFQAYYKQTVFNVWRLTLADMFRVGDEGGLYELPGIQPDELLRLQGDLPRHRFIYSNRDKQGISERYLLKYGTYTFEYPNGQVEFVVFDDEERDMPRYLEMVNRAFAEKKMPGVLILNEEKSRLAYLRNDPAWEAKEKRWQWAIQLPQSPTETTTATSSENAIESTQMTGKTS